ncbi:hypothetical protein OF83DRAFT_1087430 [Amylostereum chailletii]|nr:hypothetical protein OF83DRAFT_1087430 [Amylostereum chailletii]
MPVERTAGTSSSGSQRGGGRGRGGRGRGGGNASTSTRAGRSGGRGSGRGRGRGGGASRRNEPYAPPVFPEDATLRFESSSDPDLAAKLDRAGVKSLRFGPDFDVRNDHLLAIAQRPLLAAGLEVLSLGDSDTGCGGQLSDDGVQTLLKATPNLRSLSLDACTQLTPSTLFCALESCPRLEHLRITGHDKGSGRINAKAMKDLKAKPEVGTSLRELVLYDQHLGDDNAVIALTKARKKLTVRTGETMGNSMAASMIDDGGAMTTAYKGGKMVGFDFDEGMFGGGGFPFF